MAENSGYIGLAFIENLIIDPQNAERDEILSTGIELIPEKLILRRIEENDIKLLEKWGKPRPSQHQGLSLVLELKDTTSREIHNPDNLIFRTMTALRLFKPGRVNIAGICAYHPNPEYLGFYIYGREVSWLFNYHIDISEIEEFMDLIKKVKNIDFEKHPTYRIACNRLENSYQNKHHDDVLIDICIGFEALFLKGENPQFSRGRGYVIGLGCSMLIGLDNYERDEIFETIQLLFSTRNNIVHGNIKKKGKKKGKRKTIQLEELENYLRKSLVKLLPL